MKNTLSSTELVLHIDFVENYCCKLADEIQSFHYGASRNQVTMHNIVAYTANETIAVSTLSDNCSVNIDRLFKARPLCNLGLHAACH